MRFFAVFTIFVYSTIASADVCDNFSALLDSTRPTRVEDVLAHMSASPDWQSFLKGYLFVFKSQSVQQGTYDSPRTIVYGADGKMMMTFLGGPEKNGRDAIEVSCFRENKRAFEYFELGFDGLHSPRLENPNPGKCLVCHGSDPRPNWNAYNFWPGIYGAISFGSTSAVYTDTPEYPHYKEFLNGNRQKGRYANLAKAVTPPPEGISNNYSYVTSTNGMGTDPTGDLTTIVNALNEFRIGRMIASHPAFPRTKYLFYAIELSCKPIDSFVPAPLQTKVRPLADLQKEIGNVQATEFANLHVMSGYPSDLNGIDFSSSSAEKIAELRYAMSFLGMDFQRISTGFSSGTYNFTSGYEYADLVFERALASAFGQHEKDCATLKSFSLASLKDYQIPAPPPPPPIDFEPPTPTERQQAFNLMRSTCLNCHGVTQVKLPLGSEGELQAALTRPLSGPKMYQDLVNRILGINLNGGAQMPYQAPFPVDEQILIVRYLHELAGVN